jgi:hypothetical protein
MQVIPITAVPSQTFSVQLAGQDCDIALYQKSTGLFMDLTLNGVQILSAMLCLDRVYLVRYAYLGFVGNLAFVDTQGTIDPSYDGLGSRFILAYFPA